MVPACSTFLALIGGGRRKVRSRGEAGRWWSWQWEKPCFWATQTAQYLQQALAPSCILNFSTNRTTIFKLATCHITPSYLWLFKKPLLKLWPAIPQSTDSNSGCNSNHFLIIFILPFHVKQSNSKVDNTDKITLFKNQTRA